MVARDTVFVVACGALALCAHAAVQGAARAWEADPDLARADMLVAWIDARLGDEDVTAAGVVVGGGRDRVLVTSVGERFRRGDAQGTRFNVRLKGFPGSVFPARLLDAGDAELDLAVLEVDVSPSDLRLCRLPFDSLGQGWRVVRRLPVWPLGIADDTSQAWPDAPDRVLSASKDRITFRSASISSEHVGGALFGKRGLLLGMIATGEPPTASAWPVARLIARLEDRGLPVLLRERLDEGEATPLLAAIEAGDLQQAADLVERCGYTARADGRGWTPLHHAAAQGAAALVSRLLDAGADVKAASTEGETYPVHGWQPLHLAAITDSVDTVRVLLDRGAQPDAMLLARNLAREAGSALSLAIEEGAWRAARVLLEHGADPNLGRPGRPPLGVALAADNLEIAEQLLAHGALLSRGGGRGAPVSRAAKQSETMLSWLLEAATDDGDRARAIARAARQAVFNNEPVVLERLLEAGFDVHRRFADGRILLHHAARSGYLPAVELLLAYGSEVNARDRQGRTPLDVARQLSHDVVDLLRGHGARTAQDLDPDG